MPVVAVCALDAAVALAQVVLCDRSSDDNDIILERFGYIGQALTLAGWRAQTGLDLTSR